jgi:hypothetical protein
LRSRPEAPYSPLGIFCGVKFFVYKKDQLLFVDLSLAKMWHQDNDSRSPELGSVAVPEALPSLPTTKSAAATGIEAYSTGTISNLIHASEATIPTSDQSTATPPVESPHVMAKRRNIYIVAAFCSLGGFLFGTDTGKQFILFHLLSSHSHVSCCVGYLYFD